MGRKAPSFIDTEENLGQILDRYGLRLKSYTRPTGGVINNNFIVDTTTGKFVLRASAYGARKDEDILYELRLIETLARRGAPVTRTLLNDSGKTLTHYTDRKGHAWQVIVMHFVKGRHLKANDLPLIDIVAETHAHLHLVARRYPTRESVEETVRGHLSWLDKEIERARPLFKKCGKDPALMEIYRTVREDLIATIPRIYTLPHGEVHLDYDSDNILVSGKRVAAVIDFDDIANAPFIWDIGNSLWWWLDNNPISKHERIIEKYVMAYSSVRRATRKEIELLPLFMRIRNISIVTFRSANFAHCVKPEQIDRWIAFEDRTRTMKI